MNSWTADGVGAAKPKVRTPTEPSPTRAAGKVTTTSPRRRYGPVGTDNSTVWMKRADTSSAPILSRRFGRALLTAGSLPSAVVVTLYVTVVADGLLTHQVNTDPARPPNSAATSSGVTTASFGHAIG